MKTTLAVFATLGAVGALGCGGLSALSFGLARSAESSGEGGGGAVATALLGPAMGTVLAVLSALGLLVCIGCALGIASRRRGESAS
ncbi:MAG: hypothetical protein JJ863_06925 [Deltaproteobacteria bacterium]|nr:hypothetical protein [Deltaproteobacteria bacterium]